MNEKDAVARSFELPNKLERNNVSGLIKIDQTEGSASLFTVKKLKVSRSEGKKSGDAVTNAGADEN